jgi:hypothetical protein
MVMPPLFVIEETAWRESDLSVLVTFRAGRAVSVMTQNVAAERPRFVHLEERVLAR